MDKNLLAKACFTLFCFGVWPAVARKSGMPPGWITLFLGCALLVAAAFVFTTFAKQTPPTDPKGNILISGFVVLVIAVALNASGSVTFSSILASKNPNAFLYVALITAGVPIVIKLSGLVLDPEHESISWINILGIIGVAVFIPLIMHKK